MAEELRLSQPIISDFAEGCVLREIRLHSNSCTSERVFALRRPTHIVVTELSSDVEIVLARLGRLLQSQSLTGQHSNVEASRLRRDDAPLIEWDADHSVLSESHLLEQVSDESARKLAPSQLSSHGKLSPPQNDTLPVLPVLVRALFKERWNLCK